MNFKTVMVVLGTISSLSVAAVSGAQAADALRVRGTVVSFEPSLLTVKTRQGDTSAIKLNTGWKISGVASASEKDIKQGDFLGIASVSKADGGSGALEVVIFPAALKGTGEGDRPLGPAAEQPHDQRHRGRRHRHQRARRDADL